MGEPVTELRIADTDPARLAVDAVVIGVYQSEDETGPRLVLAEGSGSIAAVFDGQDADLPRTLHRLGATGEAGQVTKLASFGVVSAPVIAAVGLGKASGSGPAAAAAAAVAPATVLRRASASAIRALAGSPSVALALPLAAEGALRAVAEGGLLGAYRFAGYRSRPVPGQRDPVGAVTVCVPATPPADSAAEAARASAVIAAVTRARDWVNTAPNELRPPQFADAVATVARAADLDVEILDEEALATGGFGGILAVGRGSAQPPRLVRVSYRPEQAPTATVALVGKGVTFDSGGLSIKPAMGMWEMKADMAGAAAIAATMLAVAELRPPVAVTAYLPMAENMPSGTAYRPGDVVRMRSGKQVEVLNTDAEGRLLLADAIALACESSPDYLIETSTLTGGQIVALGKRVAGVMGTPELCERVRLAGERAGEPAWPMPMPEDVRSSMDSDVADISQVSAGMDRSGSMLQGGTFLAAFVAEGVSWAHVDVAGPAYHTGEATGDWSKGGTGAPVRTILDLIEHLDAEPAAPAPEAGA
ncbi:MAG: leucyl aminopeptidase [Dactylosporangium sp.]|nr:leucyl aminopeptidase [Dactylosporangium sp.]NNJ61209.1 leucyl aminopeptidase [Dactylosporangium sp.]